MGKAANFLILVLFVFMPGFLEAQDNRNYEDFFKRIDRRHSFSFFNGYVLIPNSYETGAEIESKVIFVGLIGIDYKYYWAPKFNTGLVYELELGQYFIQDEGSPVPRENVQVFTLLAGYEILPKLEIFIGPGFEYEIHKDYFILKVGLEYELLIANDWYFSPEISYNYKEVYESLVIGVHFRKKFGKALE